MCSELPTGWHLLATDPANWKQLRDESVSNMIENLQLKLRNSNNEVKLSLEHLNAAGHMLNVSLPTAVVEDMMLPVDDEANDSDYDFDENDLFANDPQVSLEDTASVSLAVLPTVDPVQANIPISGDAASSSGPAARPESLANRPESIQAWFGRSFANLMDCVIVLDDE